MAEAVGIIPARYASARLPGKPLADIGGISMIQRVYAQASKATGLTRVAVATDDERIYRHVTGFGGEAVMTSPLCPSGTDRCADAAGRLGLSSGIIVNIQGDEPFIDPQCIDALVALFQNPECRIGTLVSRCGGTEEYNRPSVVKAVVARDSRALYFSRSPVPHQRDAAQGLQFLRHIGIYAYRVETLLRLASLAPSPLERAEGLEQLRWMENGFPIHTAETEHTSMAVDTVEDLERARRAV